MKSITISKTKEKDLNFSEIHKWLVNSFNLLKYGDWEITISKPKRSNPQNALFRMWVACISETTGQSVIDIYQYYCEKFNTQYQDKFTYRKNGQIVSGATSCMKVDEFRIFMNNVQADAASEMGITLPIPQDQYYKEFYDQYYQYVANEV